MAKIIYILGIIIAIWCVLDIFKKTSIGIIGKIRQLCSRDSDERDADEQASERGTCAGEDMGCH